MLNNGLVAKFTSEEWVQLSCVLWVSYACVCACLFFICFIVLLRLIRVVHVCASSVLLNCVVMLVWCMFYVQVSVVC